MSETRFLGTTSCSFHSVPSSFSRTRLKTPSSIINESQCAQYDFPVGENWTTSSQVGRLDSFFHFRSGSFFWFSVNFSGCHSSSFTVIRQTTACFSSARQQRLLSVGHGLRDCSSTSLGLFLEDFFSSFLQRAPRCSLSPQFQHLGWPIGANASMILLNNPSSLSSSIRWTRARPFEYCFAASNSNACAKLRQRLLGMRQ